ncbi:MAG: peptide chain release factor N(5)-glutamine methyltransferase [Rhodococcus sp. (in: high G+C Gram-positive bacteria)]
MSRVPLRLAIVEATRVLAEAGVPSPRVDAELLASHLLSVPRGRLGLTPLVEPEVAEAYRATVAQRARRIPLQHIVGTSPLGEIDVEVGPGVFVPRPETELLLAWALAFLETVDRRPPVVLDLCTGSGALALAIAHSRPDAVVHAVEKDSHALAWARRNADLRASDGDTPIRLHHGDVTDRSLLRDLDGGVDIVVANPPYVPEGTQLDPEVVDHDPHVALFGGPDGLSVIEPMIANIARWLRIDGGVGVEHDDSHGDRVVALMESRAVFSDVSQHRDLADRPRFVVARRRRREE